MPSPSFSQFGVEELDCSTRRPDLNPTQLSAKNWNADCEAYHPTISVTSLMLRCPSEKRSLQPGPASVVETETRRVEAVK